MFWGGTANDWDDLSPQFEVSDQIPGCAGSKRFGQASMRNGNIGICKRSGEREGRSTSVTSPISCSG